MADTVTPAVADPAGPGSTRRERTGWYFYDWANSAFQTTVITVFLGPFLTTVTELAAGCELGADSCDGAVYPLGVKVAAGSFYPYLISLSVFLTVFVLPVIGAIADRSAHKKRLLAAAAFTGAGATIAFAFVTGERYLLGGALFLVANISFGAAVVVYNSFLPQLGGPDERDGISSRGWAIGYLGGGLLLALNLVAVTMLSEEGNAQRTLDLARWSIVSAGVWWAAFTLVPLRWLREHPTAAALQAGGNVLTDGFRQLGRTLRELKTYPLTLFFLLAFLVFNDGIQTVITLASQYGTEELRLDQSTLIVTILLVQFLAFGGALALGALAKRIGAWKTVLLSLVLWTGVIIAAFRLPAEAPVPFMILGGCIGLVLGGSQALSRSLFSQLIPAGKEGEYYGFYEISDKGTSWLGPLAFGLVFQLTSSYRVGLVSLLIFFVVGFALLAAVPMRRAIIAAGNTPPRVL
ncbi:MULTISPECIES: MFS transporter [Micromonospora]|uniref:MFS transporter n=1 Tax=Micromonospora chalcea TaxID=1874 RepID=A0ABX9Y5F5_MICCH|nr:MULTISPECIES: MFS transporter [Micromonospora]EWM63693.1 integral membrane protein [Micromonospora sp. M42]MBC8989521.1 MFS transporter [Micromonospora chalcea]MBP1783452.1 UMF1 family MFS transporter [Micromonospora sp. HB375]MBQ1059712.1 MFS transporter [Micromonospora sp. C41]MCK1807397.1 MFS transporter [Micromonospora sp. R42106]